MDQGLGGWITEFRPLASVLTGHLAAIATDPREFQLRRNSAVTALTGLSEDPTVLVPVLMAVDGPLFEVMIAAIGSSGSRDDAAEILRGHARPVATPASSPVDTDLGRARAIAALVRLDKLEELDTILAGATPSVVAKIVDLTAQSATTEILSRALQLSNTDAAVQLFLLALASRPGPENGEKCLPDIAEFAQRAFSVHPGASVHSAADLLLRRWGIPRLEVTHAKSQEQKWEHIELSGLEFVLVHFSADSFTMGSPSNEYRRESDETLHNVCLTKPFAMMDRPITVGQLAQFRWSQGQQAAEKDLLSSTAAVRVSWLEALQFCSWLNDLLAQGADPRHDGLLFRLPTEAEWEYACRNGSSTPFEFGEPDLLPSYGWFEDNSDGGPMPVATLLPSSAGLFDMHGNVYEWCSDWYGPYQLEDTTDPEGPMSGDRRVVRGGCWFFDSRFCRSAYRGDTRAPDIAYNDLGFRLVISHAFA